MEPEDSDSDLDILNNLISNDTEETECSEQPEQPEASKPKKTLTELQFSFLDSTSSNTNNENKLDNKEIGSEIYNDNIDSSDDEDRRYFEEQKYSDYGREIKQLIKCSSLNSKSKELTESLHEPKTFHFNDTIKSNVAELKDDSSSNKRISYPHSLVSSVELKDHIKNELPEEFVKSQSENRSKTFNFNNTRSNNNYSNKSVAAGDLYSDPFFGIRIISPLISSAELKERMKDKIAVTVSKVKFHIISDNVHNDWVIAGVLINKSDLKKSQKGNSYCIWKISDLSDDMKTVTIFLFNNAYKQLWKTITGTVIGILNPNVLESKDNKDQATLSIDNPQRLMVLGKSRDMGTCKSLKNNGDPCTAIVNTSRCEYCVYHVKQEYKKCSRRADLQSSNSAYGFTGDALKRMNKQNVRKPYEGLTPFIPVLAKRNEKLYEKDRARLELLSKTPSKCDSKLKINADVKKEAISSRNLEQLNKSRGWQPTKQIMVHSSSNSTVICSKQIQEKKEYNPTSVKSKIDQTNKKISLTSLSVNPRLGKGCNQGIIDFSEPITKQHINTAKMNAIKWVQKHGQIKAKDPNQSHVNSKEKLEKSAKRQRENDEDKERIAKKASISDKFKEILETKSAHTDLIEKSYDEEKEKYFDKLEKKEQMEEKMMTTFKVDCKAVKCMVCKYIAFSASDICKEKGHQLCTFDAVKRFFKCNNCGNRTVSLNRMPSRSCDKCKSSSWARAAMMDDKICMNQTTLCIRGEEEKFIGSMIKNANLDLLVPDTD